MPTTDTLTAVLERVVRSWWSHTFGDIRPHLSAHTGRPGPTDPRAATLLVWSGSASPALVTLLDVDAGPATHGFDRAWRLTEALPGVWGAAIRAVPADGPAVRSWAERLGQTRSVQATHARGRIRCTCSEDWIHGLPPIRPRPAEHLRVGIPGPPAWASASIRRITDTAIPAVVKHHDGLRVRGHLEVSTNGATWIPAAWDTDPNDALIWFEARAADDHEGEAIHLATTAVSHLGQADWVAAGNHLGLRWTPSNSTSTNPATTEPDSRPEARHDAADHGGYHPAPLKRPTGRRSASESTAAAPSGDGEHARPSAPDAHPHRHDEVESIATHPDERTVRIDRSLLVGQGEDDALTTTRLERPSNGTPDL